MNDQTATLNLILQLKAKTDELTDAQKKLASFKESIADLNKGLGAVGSGFASGLGIGGALTSLNAIKTIISESVGAMKELIVEGVNLNSQMETAQFSIAGALRQFEPERFKSFASALSGSAGVIDSIKAKSLELGLSFPDLAHTYQATVGAMFKAGIFDIQKQVDLTALLSRTLASTGVTGARAARDIADLFNGQANRIVALKGLGITNEDIQAAKAKGDLYEYIQSKLAGYSEAVDAAGQTTERLEQILSNTKSQVAADATKELTAAYKELLGTLITLVKSAAFSDTVNLLAKAAGFAVNTVSGVAKAITGAQDALSGGPKSAAGSQVSQGALSSGVSNAVALSTALPSAVGAIVPLLLAKLGLGAGTDIAQTHFNGATATQDRKDAKELDDEVARKRSTVDTENAPQIAAAEAAARFRQAEEEAGAFLEKNATKLDTLNDKLSLVGLKDEDRLKVLQEIANIKGDEFDEKALKVQAGSLQATAIEFERKKALLPILNQIAATKAKISAEEERQEKLTEAAGERIHKLNEQDLARNEVAKARSALEDIDAEKAGIVNDQYRTRLEKQAAVYALLQREPAAIDEIIKRLKTLSANTSDDSARHSIDNEVANLQGRKKGIPAQSEKVATQSLGQNVQSNLVGLQNNFTTAGQAIAQTIQGAVDSLSNGIQRLFDTSKSLGQRISGVFLGIGQSAVKAASDMAAQWLVKHTLMSAVSALFYTKEKVLHVGTELTKTGATVAGETQRTSATATGTALRISFSLKETLAHALHKAYEVATHLWAEIKKTWASLTGAATRIEATISESIGSVIHGAIQAFESLSSIPYVGPYLGAAAMAAALVAGFALVGGIKKNFADGGMPEKPGYYAGKGGPRSDSNPVNISNGEYIVNAHAVSQIGKSRLDEMNYTGRLPAAPGRGTVSNSGGGSTSGGGSSKSAGPSHTVLAPRFIMVDSDRAADRINDTEANEAYIIRIARKHGML